MDHLDKALKIASAANADCKKLYAQNKRLREALQAAVDAGSYVVQLCEANLAAGESPNPSIKADWVATTAHCYAAMSFLPSARAVLAETEEP